jgi:hypothetical protein
MELREFVGRCIFRCGICLTQYLLRSKNKAREHASNSERWALPVQKDRQALIEEQSRPSLRSHDIRRGGQDDKARD